MMLEVNPQFNKKKSSIKYHFIFLFWNFIIGYFSFRMCFTKGATQLQSWLFIFVLFIFVDQIETYMWYNQVISIFI